MKICTKCHIEKELSEFTTKRCNKNGEYILNTKCKSCISDANKKYYKLNKESIRINKMIYQEENKEAICDKNKKYYSDNRESVLTKVKTYYKKNSEDIKLKSKVHYKENKEKIIKHQVQYIKNRRLNDPLFKLTDNIRSLILRGFKGTNIKKNTKTSDILGCSFIEFKEYLEKQFDENMNWSNHGSYWHLDHKKPISLATTEHELIELNHYTNFQPLYWLDNLSKGKKYSINNVTAEEQA